MTEKDRVFLRILLEKRYSKAKIAQILDVHHSTIYREIKRNSCCYHYKFGQMIYYAGYLAQGKYLRRRRRPLKLIKTKVLRGYVHDKLSRVGRHGK